MLPITIFNPYHITLIFPSIFSFQQDSSIDSLNTHCYFYFYIPKKSIIIKMKRQQPYPQTENKDTTNTTQKKVHKTQYNDEQKPNYKKPQFILDKRLAQQMVSSRNAYIHELAQKEFYFPYPKLNQPQQNFIKSMFSCLDNKENLLIQSPTGTGKTLSLLVGALSWSDHNYINKQGGIFEHRTKIIYTSRAHSQLSQISKQLQKTPYRPHMLLFGSRQKMCINQQLSRRMTSNQQKTYNDWSHKCNLAVRMQQQYESSKQHHQQEIEQTKRTVEQLKRKPKLTQQEKQQLESTQEYLQSLGARCEHYSQYKQGRDAAFFKEVGRTVLNNEKLKQLARTRTPKTVCPYFYPKRVKIRATLYLMPYNYLLDSRILQYSTGFLQNSIIIFDQGHNVPSTACQGYSINFSKNTLQMAKRNLLEKLTSQDFDADQNQMENFMKLEEEGQEDQEDEQMGALLRQIKKKNQDKQMASQGGQAKLRYHVDFLVKVLTNAESNFQQYFQHQRTQDFKRADSSFLQTTSPLAQKRTYNWQAIRYIDTPQRPQIQQLISRMFFSHQLQQFYAKTLKEKLQIINESLSYVTKYFMRKDKKCFKIVNLARFYKRISNVLYEKDYFDKFFIEITQSKKYSPKDQRNIYKGEINIRCLAPEFSFKQLEKIKPHSIIITSGTLSPINVFAEEIGIKLVKQQVGHVITEENIIVRKVGRNLQGEILKIDSTFYSGKTGLQFENLNALFNLLIKTLQVTPHGVLVIVSSFSCLKYLQIFYKHQRTREIRRRLEDVKPHVYFEPKKNLEVTMERFNENSQQGKGALLFCVCRAKLSEGIDFKDKLCRSVIFFGIPYVSKGDPFIVEKGQYLKKMKYPYASEWKFIEASKAINQGLGRTVRHSKDYGSILLFDNRYEQTNRDSAPVVANISQWIKQNWKVNNNIDDLKKQLGQFYKKCEKKFPLSEQKQNQLEKGQSLLDGYFRNKF